MTSYRRAASFASLSIAAVGLLLMTGCLDSPSGKAGSTQAADSLEPCDFPKDNNNGTVSCDTYCAGAEWPGGTGTCTSASAYVVPCDHATGLLSIGELRCTCVAPNGDQFVKDDNNGTVSCDTYCAGAQWDPGCYAADGTSIPCVGTCWKAEADNVACSDSVGYLDNGQELQCWCKGTDGPAPWCN